MKKTPFLDIVDYNTYRDTYNKEFKTILFVFYIFIIILNLVIGSVLDKFSTSWWISEIPLVIYWCLAITFVEKNIKRRFSTKYRTIFYPFCILLIVFTIPSLLFYAGAFARYYAIGIFDNQNKLYVFAVILLPTIDFIGRCFILHYCRQWLTLLRWEFDELNLSRSKKQSILKEERTAYLQEKRQNKQARKEKRKVDMANKQQKARQNISNIKNNIIAKFDSINTQTASQTANNAPVSKLDKLNELKELHDNGIISDEEYQKARADILGK